MPKKRSGSLGRPKKAGDSSDRVKRWRGSDENRDRERERDRDARQDARSNEDRRSQEQDQDSTRRREARDDPEYRDREQSQNTMWRRGAREDQAFRDSEQSQDTSRRRDARQDQDYREREQDQNTMWRREAREDQDFREREQNQNTMWRRESRQDDARRTQENLREAQRKQRARRESRSQGGGSQRGDETMLSEDLLNVALDDPDVAMESQPEDVPGEEDTSLLGTIKRIHKNQFEHILQDDFGFNVFEDNPLIEGAQKMFEDLAQMEWGTCNNCQETYLFLEINNRGNCHRCTTKKRKEMFGQNNNVTPRPTPEVLARLTPIELSAISMICPLIGIYKKGSGGTASRGHVISFYQNVKEFSLQLPRIPEELPVILLKDPREENQDRWFHVRRAHLLEVSWLCSLSLNAWSSLAPLLHIVF